MWQQKVREYCENKNSCHTPPQVENNVYGMLICYCYEFVQIKYQRQNKTNILSISRTNLMAASMVTCIKNRNTDLFYGNKNIPYRIGKLEGSTSWMKVISAEGRNFLNLSFQETVKWTLSFSTQKNVNLKIKSKIMIFMTKCPIL